MGTLPMLPGVRALAATPHRALLTLAGLGLAMLALVAAGPWLIATYDYEFFVPVMAASGLVALAAAMLAGAVPTRSGLIVVLSLGAAMRLAALAHDPLLSTDVYRYVWDGRVQAAGINPYRYVPADPALTSLRDTAVYPNINRADYAVTAYPPVAQMFFLAATRVSETVTGMRFAMVLCEIAIIAVLLDLLRRLGLPAVALAAWVWHPLPIWEIANNGHVEALMVALVMLGIWLLARNQAMWGAVTVGLAAAVKPYAVLVLPAFWRAFDWRMPLAVIVAFALCYVPYLSVGQGVLGYAGSGYLAEEGLIDGEAFWLVALARRLIGDIPGLVPLYVATALAVLGALALRASLRHAPTLPVRLKDMAFLLMAGLFFLSPNYPWYFLVVVPFAVLGGGFAAWVMPLAGIFVYRPAILPDNDFTWTTIATLPFLIALAIDWRQRRRVDPRTSGEALWSS